MAMEMQALKCDNCKKDVLGSEEGGLLVLVEHEETGEVGDVYVSCDGECYDELKELRVGEAEFDRWRDLAELKNPVLYLDYMMELMDSFHKGARMNDKEYEKLKTVLFRCAQYVIRDLTEEEKDMAYRYKMSKI